MKEDRTYEQWIRESQDPNSFLYEHPSVIGLGLAIFGDPTTYVTFGATGASKTLAQKAWLAAKMSTDSEAIDAIRVGQIAVTGESTLGKSPEAIREIIHNATGRPWSIGDAMEYVRKVDRGERAYSI